MKSGIWRGCALALTALAPVACGGEAEPPAATAEPDAPQGITVANGRMSLPAVSGNPAAVYFDIENAGPGSKMIQGARVQGATSATLHMMTEWSRKPAMQEVTQVPIPAGETVKFEPGGMHVMALDLADTVTAGGTAEVTLNFVGGDKISFPADVRGAGDAR